MGLPDGDESGRFTLATGVPGEDHVLDSVHSAVESAHVDPEHAAVIEHERNALIAHCLNIGKADHDLERVHQMMVAQAKQKRLADIEAEILRYKPKKDKKDKDKKRKKGKKKGNKEVVMAPPPKHPYDTAPGVLELDIDGIEPEPVQAGEEEEQEGVERKKLPTRDKKQDRADLCRGGAPLPNIHDEALRIAEDRAAAALVRKELDKLDIDKEVEVEVVPWVPSTFAEKQRVAKEKSMGRLEKQLVRERGHQINEIRSLSKRRRIGWYVALYANLKVLNTTGMIGLYAYVPARVMPFLYFAGPDTAKDRDKLADMGVTHIINATKTVQNSFPGEFLYFRVKIDESESVSSDTLIAAFQSVANLLDSVEAKGGCALVHCSSGLSRAPCIVIAYLVLKQARTLKDAYNLCAAMQPNMDFNSKFLYVLARLEHMERGFTTVHRHPAWRFGEYQSWKRASNPKREWGRGLYRTFARFYLGRTFSAGGRRVAPAPTL